MNCYAAFAEAQQLENEGDNDAALAAYTELVRAARAAHSSTLTYDETSGPGKNAEIIDSVPPTALVVSVALNSLGGLLLDARKLSDASVAFEDSLSVWGANGAAPVQPRPRMPASATQAAEAARSCPRLAEAGRSSGQPGACSGAEN